MYHVQYSLRKCVWIITCTSLIFLLINILMKELRVTLNVVVIYNQSHSLTHTHTLISLPLSYYMFAAACLCEADTKTYDES